MPAVREWIGCACWVQQLHELLKRVLRGNRLQRVCGLSSRNIWGGPGQCVYSLLYRQVLAPRIHSLHQLLDVRDRPVQRVKLQ